MLTKLALEFKYPSHTLSLLINSISASTLLPVNIY